MCGEEMVREAGAVNCECVCVKYYVYSRPADKPDDLGI